MIFSLLLSLLPSLVFSSTLFIGNGGEVYKVNNFYYVRDLVEADVHIQPHFNCASENANKVIFSKLEGLDLDNDLLARKLCDLEKVSPGMGDILSSAIGFHSWTLVNEVLVLQPDDAPLVKIARSERVQAANRTLFNIRLQAHVWKGLTPEHRIALLFHEVIFSLLKATCTNSPCTVYKQSPRLAREITGQLFRESTYKNESEVKKLQSLISLSFYSSPQAPDFAAPLLKMRVIISNNTTVSLRIDKPDDQDVQDYIYYMCREYYNLYDYKQNWTMSLFIIRKDWTLEKFAYSTEYGVEYGIAIKENNRNAGGSVNGFTSYTSCEKRLNEKLKDFSKTN